MKRIPAEFWIFYTHQNPPPPPKDALTYMKNLQILIHSLTSFIRLTRHWSTQHTSTITLNSIHSLTHHHSDATLRSAFPHYRLVYAFSFDLHTNKQLTQPQTLTHEHTHKYTHHFYVSTRTNLLKGCCWCGALADTVARWVRAILVRLLSYDFPFTRRQHQTNFYITALFQSARGCFHVPIESHTFLPYIWYLCNMN